MSNQFTIRSKINVKPKKSAYVFKIILNICLAITMVAGIVKILFDGLEIATLGTMALAFIIVSIYTKRPSASEHYEFALVDISISNAEIKMIYRQIESYKNKDVEVMMPVSQINILEFSDQLCCLHICGKVLFKSDAKSTNVEEYTEHFLYLEQGQEREILSTFQQATGVAIKYMDR